MATRKYDWDRLKEEYLRGDYLSVADFLREKKVKVNPVKTKGWHTDKEEYRENVFNATTNQLVREDALDIAGARLRQARLARFMQMKGASALKKNEVDNTNDARQLLVSGIQEERKALGFDGSAKSQTLNQFNINLPKTNLDKMVEKLDYAGILGLIAQLKRERTRRSIPASLDSSPKEAVRD